MELDAPALSRILDRMLEPALVVTPGGQLAWANAAARELLGPFEAGAPAEPLVARVAHGPRRTESLENGHTLLLFAAPAGPGELASCPAERAAGEARAQALAEVSRLLLDRAGTDPASPLRSAVDRVARLFGAPCAFLLGDLHQVQLAALGGPEAERERLAALLPDGAPPALLEPARLLDASERTRLGLATGIAAPLHARGEVLGLLLVAGPPPWRPFGPAEVELASTLADRAALAVSHARVSTELARQRDEARAARASLEALVRHAPIGVAFLDRELRFALANDMAASLCGLPAAEHVGRRVEELWPSHLQPLAADLRAALERGDTGVRRELCLSRGREARYLDAAYYPVRAADGELLGVTAIVVDQTQQVRNRRRIEELASSEQRRSVELLALLQANPSPLAVFGPDDRLRYVSASFAELIAEPAEALQGLHAGAVMDRLVALGLHDAERIRERTDRLFAAERGLAISDELELDQPRRRVFRRTSTPVLSREGSYLGRLVVLLDVTAERELDRERSEFLTVASHELRTPLTPLSVGLQTLERRLVRGEPVRHELVSGAKRQLGRLNALIDDLLDFSRVESGRLELRHQLFSLDALCSEVVGDLAATAPGHAFELHRPSERVRIRGDRARLEQVLVNLLQNAVKYSPLGGKVELRLEPQGGEALVSVRDEGIGIPVEEQGRLFERFFRAHNAARTQFSGLGIGLHVAREIIERHGGRFEVESAPLRGSTFRFFVPLARGAASGPQVVFVDDGAEDVAAVRRALEDDGYLIEQAALDVALDALQAGGCRGLVVDLAGFGEGWMASWARLRTSAIWTAPFRAVLPPGVSLGAGAEPVVPRPFAPEGLAQWMRERLALAAAEPG